MTLSPEIAAALAEWMFGSSCHHVTQRGQVCPDCYPVAPWRWCPWCTAVLAARCQHLGLVDGGLLVGREVDHG